MKYLRSIISLAPLLSLLFTPNIIYGQVRIGEKAPGFITSTLSGLTGNFMIDKGGILRAKYLGYSEDAKRDFEKRLIELLSVP